MKRTNFICGYIGVVLFIILMAGCSKPVIKQSTLASEARGVTVWSMDLTNDLVSVDSLEAIGYLREKVTSKYTDQTYLENYFLDVKNELKQAGFNIIDRLESFGEIRLTLVGKRDMSIILQPSKRPYDAVDVSERVRELEVDSYVEEEARKSHILYGTSDGIREAYIEFYDSDNKFMGKISIKGKNLKPELIARTIAEYVY